MVSGWRLGGGCAVGGWWADLGGWWVDSILLLVDEASVARTRQMGGARVGHLQILLLHPQLHPLVEAEHQLPAVEGERGSNHVCIEMGGQELGEHRRVRQVLGQPREHHRKICWGHLGKWAGVSSLLNAQTLAARAQRWKSWSDKIRVGHAVAAWAKVEQK